MRTVTLILLLLLSSSKLIFSQNSNSEADTLVYFLVPQMPVYYGDYDQILENIFSKTDNETIAILKSDSIYINIQITNKGKVAISPRNYNLPEFENTLEEEINKLIWIPGKSNDKNVAVQETSPVRIIDHKLVIPLVYKRVKGNLMKCKITDEKTGVPIPNVRLMTLYNNNFYSSDNNGEVSFYGEPNDEIAIIHLNYLPFTFKAPKDKSAFQIKLNEISYELNPLDLSKYSPLKLPFKKRNCRYEDWKDTTLNSIVFIGIKEVSPIKIVKFKSIILIGMEYLFTPEEAEFNGGMECFYNYLAQNFALPENLYNNGFGDIIDVTFTISNEGKIEDLEFSPNANDEIAKALRTTFMDMPRWKPAKQMNQPIEQYFTLKITIGKNRYWDRLYS